MVIKQSEVVTYVCNKVIDSFKEVEELPSKLDIQAAISKIAENTEVSLGTKFVKELNQEVEIKKPLTTYYTKMSLNEIKACQEGIMKEMAKVKYPKIEENGDFVKLLKQLKAYAWNIKAEDIPSFLEALLKFAAYAKGQTIFNDERYEEGIYLKGEVEGGGKSTLIHAIIDGAKGTGLKASQAFWPTNHFSNLLPYCNNNMVYIEDCSNQDRNNIDETKMKAILRKEELENVKKGLDPVMMKVQSSLIAAGNVEPPQNKDRGWRIFDVIPADITGSFGSSELFNQIKEQTKHYANGIDQLFYVNYNFYQNYIPRLKIKREEETQKEILGYNPIKKIMNRAKSLPVLLSILNKMNECECPVDFHKISAKQICDFADVTNIPYDSWKIISTLKLLAANDLILKYKAQTNDMYTKYDLKDLEEVKVEELFDAGGTEDVAMSTTELILENQKKWDELITFFEKELEEKPIMNNDTNLENNNEELDMTIEESMEKLDKALKLENQQQELDNQESKIDEKYAKYTVSSHIKEDVKGKRLVLTFRDKQNPEKCYFKSYWLYAEDGLYETSASLAFSNDMKQIWQSKGRELESDESWNRFANRLMRIINGEKLVIDSECYLEFDEKGRILKIWAGKEE